jgi:hypothetical protein
MSFVAIPIIHSLSSLRHYWSFDYLSLERRMTQAIDQRPYAIDWLRTLVYFMSDNRFIDPLGTSPCGSKSHCGFG